MLMSKKQTILDAATILFANKGFKHTSTNQLCKMTDVAEGTVFYHFRTKEELFLSVLKRITSEIVEQFKNHFKETKFQTGLEMMEAAISFYMHLAGTMGERFLLLHRHDAYELAKANTKCRQHLEEIYECLADIFEQAILLGQKDGSIGDIPAKKTALIIFAMVDGLVRFNTYNLYHANSLYNDLMVLCRRMLEQKKPVE